MAGTDEPGTERVRSVDQVRTDHYLHWAALLLAGGYAWQEHGAWIGVLTVVGLITAISLTNTGLLALGHSSVVRYNRWLWVVLAFVVIAFSGVLGGTVPR